MKYVWITQHRDSFPVAVMCDVLRVSTSGYYASLDRTPSRRAQRHERIQQAVQQVHAESYGIYGRPSSRRPIGSQLLHHSDRGCQYTSDASRRSSIPAVTAPTRSARRLLKNSPYFSGWLSGVSTMS